MIRRSHSVVLPVLALAALAGHSVAQTVVINEFVAANQTGLADGDGDHEDWIELRNTGAAPQSLRGWRLTDDAAAPAKWIFPDITLAPGGFLLVWASNKDRREADAPLHTNFRLSAGGEYLALLRADGMVEDALAPVFPPQVADVSYGRLTGGGKGWFAVPTPGAENAAGTAQPGPAIREVTGPAGQPVPGADGLITDSAAAFSGVQGQGGWRYGYQEGGGVYVPASFIECTGGVEDGAWNGATQQWTGSAWAWSAAAGLEMSRQTPTDGSPGPQRFPVRRWVSTVSGRHTITGQFQHPDAAGDGVLGRVYLNGTLIHVVLADGKTKKYSLTVPLQPGDLVDFMVTSGPLDDDTQDATGFSARIYAEETVPAGVRFPVTARVQPVQSAVAAVTLYSRIMFAAEVPVPMVDDGTAGDASAGDGIYTALVNADAQPGQMIRWRISATDSGAHRTDSPPYPDPLDSARYYGTVVADPSIESSLLPVLHWFVQTPASANTATGTRGAMYFLGEFYDNVFTGPHGQSSASFPKKSYNVDFAADARFRWKDGERRVKDINLISNWGDKSKVRHTLAYEWCRRAGDPALFGEIIRVQQNGAFFCTVDMIEEGDDRYLERIGMDPEAALYKIYDRLENAATARKQTRKDEGTADLAEFIAKLGLTNPAKRIWGYDNVDIPGTINYLVTMDLINNRDQGHKNLYMVRDTNGTREWRPLSWDNDLSWGRNYSGTLGYANDPFTNNSVPGGQTNRLKTFIFDNPELNRMYWRRLRSVMDALLQPNGTPDPVVEARITEQVELLDPPGVVSDAQLDYQKWGSWGDRMTIRPAAQRIVTEHLPSRRTQIYGLSLLPPAASAVLPVQISMGEFNPAGGQAGEFLTLSHSLTEDVDISGWQLTGGVRLTIKAGTVIPPGMTLHVAKDASGFRARSVSPRGGEARFVISGYDGQLSARGETVTLLDAAGTLVDTLTYAGAPTPAQLALRVTELMYHPAPPTAAELAVAPWLTASDFEYVELRNTGASPLDLGGAVLTNAVEFTFPAGFLLAPGATVLVVANLDAFTLRYGAVAGIAGAFSGSLDNGGETLRLLDAAGEVVLEFAWDDKWQPLTDGAGYSLVVTDPAAPWDQWSEAAQWGVSLTNGGTPGVTDTAAGLTWPAWRAMHFPGPGEDAGAISGPVADPDGDGVANLLEYTLGTDPRNAGSVTALAVELSATPDGLVPVFRYTRRTGVLDATLVLESASDAGGWTPVTTGPGSTAPAGAGVESVARTGTAIAAGRRFFRIRSNLNP